MADAENTFVLTDFTFINKQKEARVQKKKKVYNKI